MRDEVFRLRMKGSYIRWASITIPIILVLGIASGRLSNSGYGNQWFDLLAKPAITPPGWVFGMAWSVLYVLMGAALAFVLDAREAKGRGVAITLFMVQLVMNLAWSPVFFGMHRIMLAFGLILAVLAWAAVTAAVFWKIRPIAGALMLPYLAWLIFASVLNWQIHELNPNGIFVLEQQGGTRLVVQ
ncbi:TspO/MBR family protein [Rhizorhabdus dicambivorans]|uniref:Tryptophan-rich sensory protein n=1 Tax=Rhizorhabdus dicambivorans TaxID=1850238 RepID=A0A2A4FU55_9SPHN|nr:TspO/MBR family protein [Rhizorhabdus dicambivorans]ATE66197.1 tryptophan-rich sensory protein [Rhizorhabdus dicambivorans]PCE41707.1 tryptophan-rich sensory protein [Rhizorhabdus dicambivorans]